MSLFKIQLPDFSVISSERKQFLSASKYKIYFEYGLEKYSNEKYLSWDRVKHLNIPKELKSPEELWFVIQSCRIGRSTLVRNTNGEYFQLERVDFLEELLHKLDLSLGGNFLDMNLTKSEQKIFLQNGIADEAISSSQLE